MKYSIIVALLAVAAVASPQSAFAYGINVSENGDRLRWGVDTAVFRMEPELIEWLPEGVAHAATSMGFEAWRGLPRVPDLVLQPGTPRRPGHHGDAPTNGVYLVRDWEGEPNQLAVTVVTYSSDNGEVLDADILVNANAAYGLLDESGTPDNTRYDIGAIMTHEAGHCLGLDESDTHPEATMWPNVVPGDTHQRTLSEDDEAGAIMNYAGELPEAALGCGQASVLGRPAQRGHVWLFALALLGLMLGFARGALRRALGQRTVAFGVGAVLTVVPSLGGSDASDEEASVAALSALARDGGEHADATLAHGALDARAEVRLAAARALERVGTPEQQALATRLAADADANVAAAARSALPKLLARTPQHWEAASNPTARLRLQHALGPQADRTTLIHGRARKLAAGWQDGLIVTRHAVRDASGAEHELQVRGGEIDGVGQLWTHTAAGPVEGAEVVVSREIAGGKRWAYHHQGFVFGGSLGEGAAIKLDR